MSVPAVAAAGMGALIVWAALKGASVTGGVRQLLGGRAPSAANVEPITGVSALGSPAASGPVSAVTSTSSVIANDGLSYVGQGHVYKWGGADVNGWDCSGFCNYVIGHDLGSPIPGHPSGAYSGHGPTTLQWALFGTRIPAGQEQPGDLVVWPATHMGIVVGGGKMVNCPGPNGTPAPVVSGYGWGSHVFRRVGAVYGGPH